MPDKDIKKLSVEEEKKSEVGKSLSASEGERDQAKKESEKLFSGKSEKQLTEIEKIIRRNQELVKKASQVSDDDSNQGASGPKTTTHDSELVKSHADEISKIQNAEEKIARLVELAVQKDPYFAIKTAIHLDNNYVLDKTVDGLTEEKVRAALIEKGLLKSE